MTPAIKTVLRGLGVLALVLFGLAAIFTLLPMPGRIRHTAPVQTFTTLMVIWLSFRMINKSERPGQTSWIAVNAIVLAIGLGALVLLPDWSGVIAAAAFVPFVAMPYGFGLLAQRATDADRRRRAAFYLRLASCFHPSKSMRFGAAFMRAYALGPIEKKVAAFGALARTATPEQVRLINVWTALARNDWTSVLDQSGGDPALDMVALAHLGRLDEMVSAYVSLSWLRGAELHRVRLYVLAFSGRVDAVRSLLNRELRSLGRDRKAYWSALAASAAGADDAASRRTLARYAETSTDETFRLAAQRVLAAGAPRQATALSAASLTTIAAIEEAVGTIPKN